MTDTVRMERTQGAVRDRGKREAGQAGDFGSLLARRTEAYRAEKGRTDPEKGRAVRTERENLPGKDIRKDGEENPLWETKEDIGRIGLEGRGRVTDDGEKDGQQDRGDGTGPEASISASACLLQARWNALHGISPSLTGTQGTGGVSGAEEADGAARPPEKGLTHHTMETKDGPEGMPSLQAYTLKSGTGPEGVLGKAPIGDAGPAGDPVPALEETPLMSLKDRGGKEGGIEEGAEGPVETPESLSPEAGTLKTFEASTGEGNPRSALERMTGPMREAGARKKDGIPERPEGAEGVSGLPSEMKTGERGPVLKAQGPAGGTAPDRNLELAATGIAHRVETMKDGERTTIRVRLYPEELGEMEIMLSLEEGKLSGKILMENKAMRQVFEERLHELDQALKACRIDVAGFEVGVGGGQHEDHGAGQDRRQTAIFSGSPRYGRETAALAKNVHEVRNTARGIDLLA